MKKRDLKELHTRTIEELQKALIDIKAEIIKMQIELSRGADKNLNSVRNKKKDLARILTVIREKEVSNA